jgi:hypothetical protein
MVAELVSRPQWPPQTSAKMPHSITSSARARSGDEAVRPRARVARQRASQAPGIGRTGMTSTESPGKFMKWGCFSNILAAASCESARTTV